MEISMIQRAALHLYHIDVQLIESARSYDAFDLTELRKELLASGLPEELVDSNGKLEPLCMACPEFTGDMGRDHCPECGGCDDCGRYIGSAGDGTCEQGMGCKSLDKLAWTM